MEFYNNHLAEVDSVDGSDCSYGLSLSHRLLTDDRLADLRRPKLIHFYVNGDIYYKGIDLSITPNRYINFQELLNDLEKKLRPNISLPMGIRKIFTRKGKQIYSFDDFEDCEAYVAAGPEPFKPLIYSRKSKDVRKPKKLAKLRNYYANNVGQHYVHHSDNNLLRNSYKPKIITVIRKSGKSHIALRVILNKASLMSTEQLIENLNESFESLNETFDPIIKLFTVGGKFVKTIEDVLRPEEMFVAMDKSGLTWKEISNIISDLFKDDYEKTNIYLRRWEINQEVQPNYAKLSSNATSVNDKTALLDNGKINCKENDKEVKMKEKKSISFERSQSMDEAEFPSNSTRAKEEYLNKNLYPNSEYLTENLIIPIGKGPLPTSHLQNIMKNELKSRRYLENTRKAMIDREKARYNRQKLMYLNSLDLRKDFDNEDYDEFPCRVLNSSASCRGYSGYWSSRENLNDQINYHVPPSVPRYRSPQLIQPIINRDILQPYSSQRLIRTNRLLFNRPQKQNLSIYLSKYRAFDTNMEFNFENLDIPKEKPERSGKIPELDSLRQFQEIYRIITQIGKGYFSRVFYGKSASEDEKEEVAIKIISKDKLDGREFLIDKEIDMLLRCRHEFVVHLLHQYETPSEIILVTELAQLGDLLNVLELNGVLSELQACSVILKLCSAILFLQALDIVHRNICLENILVKSFSHHNVDILLADFSNATVAKEPVTGLFGSPFFASPEMLNKCPYRHEVDMWSVGILSYMLLSTSHPFLNNSNNRNQLFSNIINNIYDFHGLCWNNVLREARELIDGLLNPNVEKRLTVVDVLSHPWILMEGNSTSICGKDIQDIQKSRRKDIESELTILRSKSQTKIEIKKTENAPKATVVAKNEKPANEKKTGHNLFGFFRNKKRDQSQLDIEVKKKS